MFGDEDIPRRVFVEQLVVEHAFAVRAGQEHVRLGSFGHLVPAGGELDAPADGDLGDAVGDMDALHGVDAHVAQQALGLGPDVGDLPCGAHAGDVGYAFVGQLFGEPLSSFCLSGQFGDLVEQETGDVLLAVGVDMQQARLP